MNNTPLIIVDLNQPSGVTNDQYMNYILADVNDHVIRISVMTEAYYWHYHPNSDETFIVLEDILFLDTENNTIELNKGQMVTVPANMLHRTRPKGTRSVNLTVERRDTKTVKVNRI